MNAKELRLGNLVVYNGSVFTITGITKHRVTADRGKGDVEFSASELSPLKITEYWLLKFGFEVESDEFTFTFGKLSIHLKSKFYENGRTYFNSWCIIEKQLEYVHQLQNTYLDIAGKELELLT